MKETYKVAIDFIAQAEKALQLLETYSKKQYEAKGKTMLEQIADYVKATLKNVDYMCNGFRYNHLALSKLNNYFVFYIYDHSAIGSAQPIFRITNSGEVSYVCKLNERMMLDVVDEWDGFKEEFDAVIKLTLKTKKKNINDRIAHIAYVNEQLDKWKV